jgi:hypothetical protein
VMYHTENLQKVLDVTYFRKFNFELFEKSWKPSVK